MRKLGRSAWSLAAIAALACGSAWAGEDDRKSAPENDRKGPRAGDDGSVADGADDKGGATETGEAAGNGGRLTVRAARRWQDRGPLLHLEPDMPTAAEGIAAEAHSEGRVVELGRLRLATGGRWWQSGPAIDPGGLRGSRDPATARGWRAAAELSYDLGPVRIGVTGAIGEVDGRLERGRYRDVAVSLSRTFRLSRWMHGWISLSLGRRSWYGRPLYGEPDHTTLLLSVGTTFR